MKKKFTLDFKAFINKKENLAIIVMAVVLCCGVALTNIKKEIPVHDGDVLVDSQNLQVEEAATEGETGSSLEEMRASLDLERNDLISVYEKTIKDGNSKEEKNHALKQKEELMGYMEQETAIESILETKNLPASFVIITENGVTVTVDQQDLKQNTVTKICNVVMKETGRTADKIIIQSLY